MKYDPVVVSCYLLKCSHMDRINTLYTAARGVFVILFCSAGS